MANVQMSPNPKRIKVFMGGDGQLYEGGAEENLGGQMGNQLGTNKRANRFPEETQGEKKEKK